MFLYITEPISIEDNIRGIVKHLINKRTTFNVIVYEANGEKKKCIIRNINYFKFKKEFKLNNTNYKDYILDSKNICNLLLKSTTSIIAKSSYNEQCRIN